MSQEISPLGESVLLKNALDKFDATFKRPPTAAACAPGRVNLIGDHIDYCEGFVLPAALPFLTVVVGAYNNSTQCNVVSVHSGQERRASFPAPVSEPLKPGEPAWANYIKGVVAHFPDVVSGFDAVVVSDVPIGAGLSSSAALEVSFFTFLEVLTNTNVKPVVKAQLCQKAEHTFPGMPCGIMDQYIASLAKQNHALLIDCRSLEAKQVPVMSEEVVFLVVNSNVKHQLTGSEYPQRRNQCQKAAVSLGYKSLRSAKIEDIEELKSLGCDELVIRRAHHVIEEITRTVEVANCLVEEDFVKIGELFYKSHESLSKLMETSCEELDQLVELTRGVAGVYGARMTGGGFGGCVVVLVKAKEVKNLQRRILTNYKGAPTFFVCRPSNGARKIDI